MLRRTSMLSGGEGLVLSGDRENRSGGELIGDV